MQASHFGGFSRYGALAVGRVGFVLAARGLCSCGFQALEHRLKIVVVHRLSCSSACGIFPEQGSNLFSALAGGFFTTELSGTVTHRIFNCSC